MKITGVHDKATAFDGAAALYERARPGYPADAVRRLVAALDLGPGRRVADVAAGTGKLTRDLVGSGAQVIAVEPVAGMRTTLAGGVTSVPGGPALGVVGAVAQALPLGDRCLDAVTVAQGFHWFATAQTLSEFRRVLVGDGRLALVWNRRDDADPLQAELTAIMAPHQPGTPSYATGEWRRVMDRSALFAAADEFHVPWRQPTDGAGVVDRVASVSFIAALGEAGRRSALDAVRRAAAEATVPVSLAYTADVYVFAVR
ncbi:MAG: class I SAM-dependent methyltransferase [Acidimicrobiales bacterium]